MKGGGGGMGVILTKDFTADSTSNSSVHLRDLDDLKH